MENNKTPDDNNIKSKYVRPEREKGSAPPDYMPSIFGWISMEEQAEQAKEITDFTKKLKSKNQNNKNEYI